MPVEKERGTCANDGCGRPRKYKGTKNGRRVYARLCAQCHTSLYSAKGKVRDLLGEDCASCGWAEAVCDLHRIVPGSEGGEYHLFNTIPLCPNCHRLAGDGLLDRDTQITLLAKRLLQRVKSFHYGIIFLLSNGGDTRDTGG